MSNRPLSALAAPWTPASLTDVQPPGPGEFPSRLPHRTASESPLDSPMNYDTPAFPPFRAAPAAIPAVTAPSAAPATTTTWKSTSVRFGAPSLPWRAPPASAASKPAVVATSLGNSPDAAMPSRLSSRHSFSRDISIEPHHNHAGSQSHSPLPPDPPVLQGGLGSSVNRDGDLTPSKLENLARLYGIPPPRKTNSSPSNASTHSSSNRDQSSYGRMWPSERSPMVGATTPKQHSVVPRAPSGPFKGGSNVMPVHPPNAPMLSIQSMASSSPGRSYTAHMNPGTGSSATVIPRKQLFPASETSPIGRANGVGASLTNRPGVSFAASSVGDGDSIIQHVWVPDFLDEDGMGEYVMCAGGGYYDAAAGVFMRPAYEMDADEVGSQFSVGAFSTARDELTWRQQNPAARYRDPQGTDMDDLAFDDFDEDDDCRGSSLNSDEQRWLEEQLQGVSSNLPSLF